MLLGAHLKSQISFNLIIILFCIYSCFICKSLDEFRPFVNDQILVPGQTKRLPGLVYMANQISSTNHYKCL